MNKLTKEKSRHEKKTLKGPQRQVEFLGLMIIVAALIVGYVVLIKPEFRLRTKLETQKLAMRDDLRTHNNKLSRLKRITNSYDQVSNTYRQFVDEFIPDGFDYSSVLINFAAIAHKNNMQVLSMEYTKHGKQKKTSDDKVTLEDSLVPIDISLSVGGSSGYNNFKSLMRDIENNSRLTEVITFSFDPLAEEYNINLRIYYYSPPDVINSKE